MVLSVRNGGSRPAPGARDDPEPVVYRFRVDRHQQRLDRWDAAITSTASPIRGFASFIRKTRVLRLRSIAASRWREGVISQGKTTTISPIRAGSRKQVEFLDAHPDHALVGTRAEIWVGDKPTGRFHDHPTEDAELRFALLFNNYFVHSSVMMRKAALDEVGVYTTDRSRQPPEDYELWSRIARRFRVANLPERLTIYREVPTSMSREGADPFKEKLILISAENLAAATQWAYRSLRAFIWTSRVLFMVRRKNCHKTLISRICARSSPKPAKRSLATGTLTRRAILWHSGSGICGINSWFTGMGCARCVTSQAA